MSYLVVLVVNNPSDCPAILDSWEASGIKGVTILESSGLGRLRGAGLREDMPLMPSLRDLFESKEERHRTMFSVVDSQEEVDMMVSIAQGVIGDLDQPHTGFLFVVPVVQVYGLGRRD